MIKKNTLTDRLNEKYIGVQYNEYDKPYLLLVNDKEGSTKGHLINELYETDLFKYADAVRIMEEDLNEKRGFYSLPDNYSTLELNNQLSAYSVIKYINNYKDFRNYSEMSKKGLI